jgi:iron complex outermembrane receptor protein
MASVKTVPSCNLLSPAWRHRRQWAKKTREINMVLASLILLLLIFCPVCGFSEDKTDTPQAVEGRPANSDQATGVTAQKNETKKVQSLEPIVVTATRTEKSLSDVPADVSVVTSQDIESRNIQKVDEAVDLLPGVFDKRSKGLDTTGSVIMRGIPNQVRNLVLLDGEPLNNGYTGIVNWNSINPEDVASIEVARGPFSSLYGGNAMGGVVNILTRTPQEREVTIKSGYGTDNTWTEYASYGDKLYDRLSVFASFGYKQSDGYPTSLVVVKPGTSHAGTPVNGAVPTTDNQGNPAYIIGNTGDNNWWTDSGSVKLVYDIDANSKAFFSYRIDQYGYGYDNPQSFLNDSSGNNIFSGTVNINGGRLVLHEGSFLTGGGGVTQNIYHGGYETQLFNDAVLKISGGFLDMPDNWYVTPTSATATRSGGPGTISSTPSQMYHTDVQLSFPVFEKHLITFGGAFRYDEATNQTNNLTDWTDTGSKTNLTYEAKGKDNIFSFYTQAEIALLRNLTLYAGARGDYWETYDGMANQVGSPGFPQYYDSNSDFSINPKGSLVYKPLDTTTLRASIGTAFRPPDVYELYRTWVTSYGTTYQANPNLIPETSFSWDLGVEQKLGSSTVLKFDYFNNTIHDFIYAASVSPNLNVETNAGKAETDGFEFGIETKPWECLKVFSNATYIHSEMLDNPANPLTVGKQLVGVPEYMFNLGGELTYRKFSFTLTGRYVAKQYSNDQNLDRVSGVYGSYDSYFVADLYVRYKLTNWVTLDFAINNMLGEEYFAYYQAPGRQFFGGLTAKF